MFMCLVLCIFLCLHALIYLKSIVYFFYTVLVEVNALLGLCYIVNTFRL